MNSPPVPDRGSFVLITPSHFSYERIPQKIQAALHKTTYRDCFTYRAERRLHGRSGLAVVRSGDAPPGAPGVADPLPQPVVLAASPSPMLHLDVAVQAPAQ